MGRTITYPEFLAELDNKLNAYYDAHKEFIHCQKGCSACCEQGDYPISDIELEYLMQGFIALDNELKIAVQQNIRSVQPGGKCPFLVNNECSIYPYRPVICRTHGLAYLMEDGTVNVPYCVNSGKNYVSVYNNGSFFTEPIKENLRTENLLKEVNDTVVMKNLYDWIRGQ